MTTRLLTIRLSLVVAFPFLILVSHAQLLLSEDFNTSSGNTINNLGWFTDCGSPDILVSSGGLTYPGYIGSGIGNAAQLLNFGFSNGGAHTKNFGGAGTPIYVGFLINVTAATGGTPGGGGCSSGTPGILAFDDGGGGSGNDDAFIVQDVGGGFFRIGLMSGCCSFNFGSTNLSYNTTHLIVIRRSGSNMEAYVNPVLGQPPGGSEVFLNTGGGGSFNGISISSRDAADLLLDGLRVSNDWNVITAVPPTTQTTNITFSNIQQNSLQLNYTSGNGTGRIVVAKQGSPVDAFPVSGTSYFANSSFGFGQEIGTGNYVVLDQCCTGPHSIFNLNPGTTYHFQAFEYNNQSGILLYNTLVAAGNPASIGTLFSEPSQASNITYSSITPTSLTINWNTGSGTGRLVYGRQGNLFSNSPLDGTTYSSSTMFMGGSDLGNNTFVVHNTGGTSTPVTGLLPGSQYEFMVAEYSGTGSQINYNINGAFNNPLTVYTLAAEPSAHSGLFSALNSGTNQINLSFSAANTIPNASGYIILRRQDLTNPTATGVTDGIAPGSLPLTGGTSLVEIITNTAQVSYNDNSLSPATTYNYAIIPFGFNGSNNQTYNYRTAATIPTTASFTLATEPTAQPTSINFTSPTSTGFTVGYTAASGSPTGYIAIRNAGSSPSGTPPLVDGTAYALNAPIGGGNVAYVGSALNFSETGLSASTVYHYDIYSYNGSGPQINYRILSPLEGSRTTLATEPTAQPTALNFSAVTTTSFNASFTAASGSPAGYMVLRREGSSPTGTPSDGTTYTVGNAIGDGTVVAIGSPTSFSQSSLSPGTTYFYDIFSLNGTGQAINYRTTSPLEGSRITLSSAPVANAGSSIATTSFTASWNSVTGATNYRLDVSTDNFSTFVSGYNNLTVAGTSQNVTGLAAGTSYQYRVRANNASGVSANSNTIILPTLCVAPVANGVSVLSSSGFDVSWNAVTGATSYALDVSTTNFSTFVPGYNGLVVAGTSSSVTGLNSSTAYSYRVRAVNASGASVNSNTINATTLAPGPVATTATAVSQTGFTANWSAVGGAKNYSIDVGDVGFANLVPGFSNLTVAGTSQAVSGLMPGVTYEYRVRANNVSGSSSNSNVISVVTVPTEPVASAASSISQTGFTANWTSVTGATSYLLEVSDDGFTSLLPDYGPKEVTVNSDLISDLSVGTEYVYRVKAKNNSGQSGYSNVINQFTIPSIPTDLNASQITSTSFLASWSAVPGAEGYELDVSIDNFTTFVAGYNARQVVGAEEEFVTGLIFDEIYKFRVRSYNSGGLSDNSSTKSVLTAGGTYSPPSVTAGTSSSSSVSASVSGGAGILTLTFYHRRISEENFTIEPPQTVGTGSASFNLQSSYFDEIGMEYYFVLKDEIDTESTSSKSFIYVNKSSESIPNLSFGGKRENYRIFSIPLQLSDNTIDNIFNPVIILYGGYKKDKWRLVQYLNGRNVDYTEGLTRIDQGKGYWFNSVDPITLNLSGSSIPANQSQPFVMSLSAGWNQIGNPFNFPISWSDVLAQNGNPTTVSGLFTYNSSSISFDSNTPLLDAWEGGFVRADQAISLNIPVTVKRTPGRQGRINEIENSELDENEWFLPIRLEQGVSVSDLAGIGMHPEASVTKDRFDEHTLPRFVNYLELNSYHEDYFMPKFTKDVVTTRDAYTWDIIVESNFEDSETEILWDNNSLGQNAAQLWLIDDSENIILDMKKDSSYRFPSSSRHALRIVFGADEKSFIPPVNSLGRAYPNPFTESVSIPIISNGSDQLALSVYDLMGRKVKSLVVGRLEAGYHEVVWNGTTEQGTRVSQGVYIYKLSSPSQSSQLGRLVLR